MAGAINIPNIVANDYKFIVLADSWYEEEFDDVDTLTLRFSRRRDHTGVLIKINTTEFLKANS